MTPALKTLIEKLRVREYSVSFAESCTGGLLSAKMAAVPGVSDIYMGSVVTYSNAVKTEMLGVSENVLKSEGAVSASVARQMAQGVRTRLKTKCSIAVTGIAGPSGGSKEKPVGTVWFAVSGPGVEVTEKKLFSGNRVEVQEQASEFAYKLLSESI